MGEVAATTAAFDQEFAKALTNLIARKRAPPPEPVKKGSKEPAVQVERVSVWQQLQKLGDLMEVYFNRLPHHVGVPRMIEKALMLQQKGEFKHAWTKGFQKVELLGLLDPNKSFNKLTASDLRRYEVQARFGSAMCEASLLKLDDSGLRHPSTVGSLLRVLSQLREAMQIVVPDESLYWLVYNGSVNIFTIAAPLLQAGFAAEVVEFLLYAVVALESVLVTCAPKYLPWRMQLVTAVCQCYVDLQVPDKARDFVVRQLDRLRELQQLETIEPIPLTPETARIYKEAENKLQVLLFRTGQNEHSTAEAVVAHLEATFDTPGDSVRALLEAMRDPARRTMRHSELPEAHAKLMAALDTVAWPYLGKFVEGVENRQAMAAHDAAVEERVQAMREREEAAAQAAADGQEAPAGTEPPAEEEEALGERPADISKEVVGVCAVIPMELHMLVVTAVFNYSQEEFLAKVLQSAHARLQLCGEVDALRDVEMMTGLVAIFEGVKKVQANPEPDNLTQLVDTLAAQRAEVAYRTVPDVITDAALLLWSLTKSLMDALFAPTPDPVPMAPENHQLVEHLLLRLHTVFTKLDLDDGLLRGVVACRLLLLLEESGRLTEARTVALEALAAAHAFRGHFTERSRHAPDERRRWLTAMKPFDEVETGVGETEMSYSCLHADLYSVYVRIELKLGVLEQEAAARRRKGRAIAVLEKRDQQVDIFGTKTPGEARTLTAAIYEAEKTPPNAVAAERMVLKAAEKNPYEKALALMQMAPFHPSVQKRAQLLQEAASLLMYAEAAETSLGIMNEAAPKETTKGVKLPPPPRIVTRTSTTLTVVNATDTIPGFRKRGVKAVAYAVYCKPYGSGVGASLNSTEYEGSGVPTKLGEQVKLRGLAPNETYIIAITMLDEHGDIINGLGQPTPEIPALFPLPTLLCWAYLGLTAYRLGCPQLAAGALAAVMHHFTCTRVAVPVWTMNPFDALALNMTHVVAAPFPLLRALCQTLWVAAELESAGVQPVPHASQAYISSQVARIKMAKNLALAMEVAVYLKDEGMLNESALRLYNAIAPLLTGSTRSDNLAKVFATAYAALGHLQRLRDDRALGAIASITYELVGLYRGANEAAAAAHFCKLDLPLLGEPLPEAGGNEPPPPVDGEGEAAPARNEDVVRLQEYLMAFPEVEDFKSDVLAVRMADTGDLPAQVQSLLRKGDVPGAYALVKGMPILQPPAVEAAERHMPLLFAGAAGGAPKAPPAKPKTPPKGELAPPKAEVWPLDQPRNPDVITAAAVAEGYEEQLQQLVVVCQEAVAKGYIAEVKEWINAALDALKAQLKCTPHQCGQFPLPAAEAEAAAVEAAAATLTEEEKEGLTDEELRTREKELVARERAALNLQRYLPALLAWRKHRMATRDVRRRTFLYRAQLLQMRAMIEFEEERLALAGGRHPLGDAAVVEATGEAKIGEEEEVDVNAPLPVPPSATVVQQLAQAVCLASRGGLHEHPGCYVQLINAAKSLWNAARYLLHRHPELGCYFGRAMVTACEPLNQMVDKCRNDGLWLGPIRLARGVVALGRGEQIAEWARRERPESRGSGVSFGSDLQVDSWYAKFSWLDMEWVHKVMTMGMLVASVANKAGAALRFGSQFNDLTDSRYAESLAPLLLTAARRSNSDVRAYTALRDQILRDLPTFMEALLLARQVWRKAQKRALVVDRNGQAMSVGSLGSKKGSQVDAKSQRHSQHSNASRLSRKSLTAAEQEEAQLNQAVKAYTNAIEVLTYRGEKDLLSQAQNELGDIYAAYGRWDQAVVVWNDAVDGITEVYKCIRTCEQFALPDMAATLARYGYKKCLMAGVVFAKLSKFGYPGDLTTRLHAALAAANFLSALFACSINHPQRALDFAEYCPKEIWEGLNLFSDPYQCNVSDLCSALHHVAVQLLMNMRPLVALPVLSFLEYCAFHVTRDVRLTVTARLLRARALSEAGVLPAAARTLVDVIQGRALPGLTNANVLAATQPADVLPTTAVPYYQAAELPGSPANQMVVKYLVEAALPERQAELYGAVLRMELKQEVAAFLLALARVPNCWVVTDPRTRLKATDGSNAAGTFEWVCVDHARAALAAVVELLNPPAPAAAEGELPPRALSAADVAMLARAHLQLAEADRLAYKHAAAVGHIKAALAVLASPKACAAAATVASELSDDGNNLALGGVLWMQARVAQLEVLRDLGHTALLEVAYTQAVKEAGEVNETWHATRLALVRATVDMDAGRTEVAEGGLAALADACDACGGGQRSAKGVALATVLSLSAELKRRCAQYDAAEYLLEQARALLEAVVQEHGLTEIASQPKMHSAYVVGTAELAKVLLLLAELRLISQDAPVAYVLLRQALGLAPFMRASPQLVARVLLLLGRTLRLQSREYLATQPLTAGAPPMDAALVDPDAALTQCLTVCTLDGGHDWGTLHEAVLERASLAMELATAPPPDAPRGPYAHEHAVAQCSAFLQVATSCAAKRSVLLQTPHVLSASIAEASLGSMPEWIKSAVLEAEQFQETVRGQAPGGALPQGRLLVELLVALHGKQYSRLLLADHTQAQVAKLHAYLKGVCPEYAKQCCFEDVPALLPAPDWETAPAALPVGTVLMQWREVEDPTIPQPPALKKGAARPQKALLVLPRAEFTVEAVFVVVAEPAPDAEGEGEAAPRVVCHGRRLPQAAVKATQAAVKALGVAMDASAVRYLGKESLAEIEGVAPPTAAEVTAVVACVGGLFSGKEVGLETPELEPGEESPFTLQFVNRLESLLNTSDGIHVNDTVLANWLVDYLAA